VPPGIHIMFGWVGSSERRAAVAVSTSLIRYSQ
jgi:hypothetical protein